MAPTPSKSGLTPQQQRERRSKIMAIALSGVLLVVVVIQVPKLMKGHKTATATAAPVASTASTTDVTGAGATVDPSTVVTAGTPPPGQLTAFTHFVFKDPFKQQVTAASAGSSTATAAKKPGKAKAASTGAQATTTTQAETPVQPPKQPAKKSKAAKKTVVKPKPKPKPLPPNAMLIAWNGKKQLVPVGVSFPTKSPLFKLVGLSKKIVHIGVLGGSFTSGSPTMAVHAGQKLTLDNESDGTHYVFKVLKLVAATAAEIAAATPQPAGTSTTAGTASGTAPAGSTTPSSTTPSSTTPASTTPTTTTTAATTTTAGQQSTTTPFAFLPGVTG